MSGFRRFSEWHALPMFVTLAVATPARGSCGMAADKVHP